MEELKEGSVAIVIGNDPDAGEPHCYPIGTIVQIKTDKREDYSETTTLKGPAVFEVKIINKKGKCEGLPESLSPRELAPSTSKLINLFYSQGD